VHEHLLGPWIERFADVGSLDRSWRFAIVTHYAPDFDSLTSIWLLRHLVESGEFPRIAEALSRYATIVDQGEYKLPLSQPLLAPHLAYLVLQNIHERDYHLCLQRGLALLDAIESWASAKRSPGLDDVMGFGGWRAMDSFADVAKTLDDDLRLFEEDLKHLKMEKEVDLPTEDLRDVLRVKMMVLSRSPRSKLNKYWVRARGCPYFVCPYGEPEGGIFSRVVLSIDPTRYDSGRRPSLRGLGAALELEECAVRSGTTVRGGIPRWDDGSVDNDDPWYDGRAHEYGIVDTPRCGTLIPFDRVCEIATGAFWHSQLENGDVWFLRFEDEPLSQNLSGPSEVERSPLLPILDEWFSKSTESDPASVGARELPPGVTSERRILRIPPTIDSKKLVPSVALELFRASDGATAEGVVEWCDRALRSSAANRKLFAFARIRLKKRGQRPRRVDHLLRAICAGGIAVGDEEGGKEIVFVNGRAIAIQSLHAESDQPERARAIMETLLYVVYQSRVLERLASEAAREVDASATNRYLGVDELLQQYLVFKVKYSRTDISGDDIVRDIHTRVRESLGIDALDERVSAAIDRLVDLRRESADERTAILLFVVGLTSVISAGTVELEKVHPWQWAFVALLSVVASIVYFRIRHRPNRRLGRADRSLTK